MKKIALKSKSISLPETWEECTQNEVRFIIQKMMNIRSGSITPLEARVEIFAYITGFYAKQHVFGKHLFLMFWFLMKFIAVLLYSCVWAILKNIKLKDAGKYLFTWFSLNKPLFDDSSKELISLNLIRLSELIEFPFKVKDHKTVIFNYNMKRNPLPAVNFDGKLLIGKFFNIGPIVQTNITAQEFCDAFDAYRTIGSGDEMVDKKCINLICAILYPKFSIHAHNINSPYVDEINRLTDVDKFIILYWFQCICEFFFHHDIYSLLFQKNGNIDTSDKISVGMDEIIMNLSLAGFDSMSGIENRTVIDFFDMQIEHIRFRIRESLGKGAKYDEIANIMHLTINQVKQLS